MLAIAAFFVAQVSVYVPLSLGVDLSVVLAILAPEVVLYSLLSRVMRWRVLKKICTCPPGEEVLLKNVQISIAASTEEDHQHHLDRR